MQVGTIVHFRPGTTKGQPNKPYRRVRCIPAVVTQPWTGTYANLVVLPDGSNDLTIDGVPSPLPVRWETSITEGPVVPVTHGDHEYVPAEFHLLGDCTYGDSEK